MPGPAPTVLTLAAAGALQTVRVADVDSDGVDELVLQSDVLEVVDLDGGRARVPLPDGPLWWDAGHGLWGVDADGLVALQTGERLATWRTGVPLGPAMAAQTPMVRDLDGDGRIELLVPAVDAARVLTPAGRLRAEVPAPPSVALEGTAEAGGLRRSVRLTAPALAAADLDGDGSEELLVMQGRDVTAWTTSEPPRVAARFRLPSVLVEDIEPDAPPTSRWADLTGDGRADLLVHRLRTDGRLTGTEAEVHLYPGTGAGLGAPQVAPTGAGSAEAFLVDFDGDGDQDVVLPQLALDAGNLAQAVLDRTVDVRLTLLRTAGGRLGEPERVGHAAVPVEDTRSAWSVFADLDGDALPDLALAVDRTLRVHRNDGQTLSRRATTEATLPHGVTNLWPVDLTGDGAAELVGWSPGDTDVVIVRLR